MNNFDSICEQFAQILKGKSRVNQGSCSVSLHRNFKVLVQGRQSGSAVPVGVSFESIDQNGNALAVWPKSLFYKKRFLVLCIQLSNRV